MPRQFSGRGGRAGVTGLFRGAARSAKRGAPVLKVLPRIVEQNGTWVLSVPLRNPNGACHQNSFRYCDISHRIHYTPMQVHTKPYTCPCYCV